jgi:NTE family protein
VIIRAILNPANLIQLPFVALDRTDLAAEMYDRQLFDESTYADLLERKTRPFVVVNSTRVARGHRVEFTQEDFDLLGSDLGSVPLGWAAAASSAYPIAFSPIRLRYYANPAAHAAAEAAVVKDDHGHVNPRRASWARELLADQADTGALDLFGLGQRHRFLHLFDAGVSDNTGLHHIFESTFGGEIGQMLREGRVKHFVVIAVNAGVSQNNTIERLPTAPGLLTMFTRTAEAPINVNTSFSISAARFRFEQHASEVCEAYARADEWRKANCPDGIEFQTPPSCEVQVYFIELALSDLADEKRRERLMQIPTSLFLNDDDVDEAIKAGGDLLREHPRFQSLLKNLTH